LLLVERCAEDVDAVRTEDCETFDMDDTEDRRADGGRVGGRLALELEAYKLGPGGGIA
jgi:hypothetical protein